MDKSSSNSMSSKAQLDKAWADAYLKAEQQFAHITKKYLKDSDGTPILQDPISPRDLTAQVQTRKKNLEKDRESYQKWTKVLESVLLPVERLGGLAAGAVSVALPGSPAGFAFNALSFVIQVGHEVSNSYDTLADLFDQVAQCLIRLDHHASAQGGISGDLFSIISQIFICLIVISALSIQLLKQKLVVTYIKTAFLGSDPKIAAQLAKIQRITTDEGLMVGALTYEQVREIDSSLERLGEEIAEIKGDIEFVKEVGSATSGDVKDILSIVERRELSSKAQEQMKTLKEIIKPLLTNTVEDIYHGLVSALTPETGIWIQKETPFKNWLEPDSKLPLLTIAGESGTGKSHLAARIIERLTYQYPQSIQHPSRVSVIYHFCKANISDLQSFNKALRAMICSVALNDPNYRDFFDKEHSSSIELQSASIHQLWTKLFVDFFQRDKKSRVYMVIDAFDQALASERAEFLAQLRDLQRAITAGANHRISVLLVVDISFLETLQKSLEPPLPTVTVSADQNLDDIRLFVTKKIDAIKNLDADPGLKSEIIDKVPKNANGNFQLAGYAIEEIRKKGRAEDVRQVLNESPADLPEAIRNMLSRLGESLEPFEIQEVNEILKWVLCSQVRLTLGQLDLMLALNPEIGGGLGSLESRLRNRYKDLFIVQREDGKSTEELRSLQITSSVKMLMAERPVGGSELASQLNRNIKVGAEDLGAVIVQSDPDTTFVELANGSIANVFESQNSQSAVSKVGVVEATEVNIVQHFLSLVCVGDMYERFGFKEFFEQKLQQKAGLINVDLNTAMRDSLKSMLGILCEDERWEQYDSKKSKPLLDHITTWFPSYIDDVGWDLIEESEKKKIGKFLMMCLRNEKIIKRWAVVDLNVRYFWIRDKETCTKALKILKDKAVSADFSEEDKLWIESLTLDDPSNLILPTIKHLAKQWLKGTEDGEYVDTAPSLILDYMDIVEYPRAGDKHSESNEEDQSMDSRTLKAARWADFEEDSIWHERVGLALLEAGCEVKAIEEFEKAKAQDQANWRADIGLAKALSKSSEKRLQAIDMMEKTLQVLEQNTNWMSDNESLYQKFCLDLAGFYIANADGEKAAGMYHKVWKLSSNDLGLQAVAPLVRLLVRQPNFLEIVEILRAMAEDQADNAEFDRLTEFYHDSSNDIELHRHIATAARKSDSVDFLRESYQKAIGEAEKKSLSIISDYLLFDYAKLLLLDYGEVSRATQILEAVLLMTTTRSIRDSVFYLREEAKTSLCAIYYEQAKLAGIGSQVAKNCIDKLRKLAAPDTDDDSDSDVSQMTNPVQVLGQWLKQEEKDDIGARKIFQRHVKLGIEWLSDSDPYNDEDAYRNLAFAFLYYGDYDNALAAFSLLGPVEPDPDTEASESDGTSDDQPATEDALGADINQDIGDVGAKDVNSEPRDPSTEEALDPPRASLKHSDAEHEGATDVTENSTATGDKADILESGRQMPDDEVTKRTKPGKDEELVPESGTFPPAADNSHLDMDDKAAEESTPIASWETGPILDEMAYKWICDGGCGRVTNFHHDIHFCKSCLLLGFCPECHEQLQSDKLGFRICSSAHHWLDVPKASERLPWGQVRFRGELKPIEEWKADIKKEWGL